MVVTPAGESPIASGGAELGPCEAADDCVGDDVILPPGPPSGEHPVTEDKPAKPVATTNVPHSRGR